MTQRVYPRPRPVISSPPSLPTSSPDSTQSFSLQPQWSVNTGNHSPPSYHQSPVPTKEPESSYQTPTPTSDQTPTPVPTPAPASTAPPAPTPASAPTTQGPYDKLIHVSASLLDAIWKKVENLKKQHFVEIIINQGCSFFLFSLSLSLAIAINMIEILSSQKSGSFCIPYSRFLLREKRKLWLALFMTLRESSKVEKRQLPLLTRPSSLPHSLFTFLLPFSCDSKRKGDLCSFFAFCFGKGVHWIQRISCQRSWNSFRSFYEPSFTRLTFSLFYSESFLIALFFLFFSWFFEWLSRPENFPRTLWALSAWNQKFNRVCSFEKKNPFIWAGWIEGVLWEEFRSAQ